MMNMINQFPDISMKMRDKFKARKKSYQWKIENAEITYDKNLAQTKFYNNEFKKWHIKLVFIIVFVIASFYLLVSGISWFFK